MNHKEMLKFHLFYERREFNNLFYYWLGFVVLAVSEWLCYKSANNPGFWLIFNLGFACFPAITNSLKLTGLSIKIYRTKRVIKKMEMEQPQKT